eukprot:6178508-Pyramimonas_sp.AAC.1
MGPLIARSSPPQPDLEVGERLLSALRPGPHPEAGQASAGLWESHPLAVVGVVVQDALQGAPHVSRDVAE